MPWFRVTAYQPGFSRIVLIQPGTDFVEHIAALFGEPREMR
jgi:hypothetical protein